MVQALLSYQERLREILISKLGWGQHDVIRTFPYSLPLCQLSARPLPGQLTTSAAGMDEKPSQKYIKNSVHVNQGNRTSRAHIYVNESTRKG